MPADPVGRNRPGMKSGCHTLLRTDPWSIGRNYDGEFEKCEEVFWEFGATTRESKVHEIQGFCENDTSDGFLHLNRLMFVLGDRGCGKTTLIRQAFRDAPYVPFWINFESRLIKGSYTLAPLHTAIRDKLDSRNKPQDKKFAWQQWAQATICNLYKSSGFSIIENQDWSGPFVDFLQQLSTYTGLNQVALPNANVLRDIKKQSPNWMNPTLRESHRSACQ